MKRIFAALSLALAAACVDDVVMPVFEVFRDPSAQIASQTNVTADRMAGEWVIRQGFANQPAPMDTITFTARANGNLLAEYSRRICTESGCRTVDFARLYAPNGPGRWRESPSAAPSFFDSDLWVMWMDFDTRTAAIGNPTGHIGWIMDKNPTGGGDRITAARDIMDWYGYDVERLAEVIR